MTPAATDETLERSHRMNKSDRRASKAGTYAKVVEMSDSSVLQPMNSYSALLKDLVDTNFVTNFVSLFACLNRSSMVGIVDVKLSEADGADKADGRLTHYVRHQRSNFAAADWVRGGGWPSRISAACLGVPVALVYFAVILPCGLLLVTAFLAILRLVSWPYWRIRRSPPKPAQRKQRKSAAEASDSVLDALVIGFGISGIMTAKALQEKG
jgi:hypothetical protein